MMSILCTLFMFLKRMVIKIVSFPLLLLTAVVGARSPIRESGDFITPRYEPSRQGYSILIDTHDNLKTPVELPKYKRTLTQRFKVDTGDVRMDELNRDLLALIERYYLQSNWLKEIYYDPLWLAAAINIDYKGFQKTYMDDDFFINLILNKDRYFADPNVNRYTGFDWQEILFTFETDDFTKTPMHEVRFKNGFIKYVDTRSPLKEISPVIPQDFALNFTGSVSEHRFDMTLVNRDYFNLVGRWRYESFGDRWSYADAYNLLFGSLNERALRAPNEFVRLNMDNHYKTSMNYILNYGRPSFTPYNDEIEYNYQYFDMLYSIIYSEKYPKFRYQRKLMDTIKAITEADPLADAKILTNWCEYIILEARYTGEW